MRVIYYCIDNIFKTIVPDDATDKQISDMMYDSLRNILHDANLSDFMLVIEEDVMEE